MKLVRRLYAEGKQISVISLDEVQDEWLVASPYYVGTVAPPPEEVKKRLAGLPTLPAEVSTLAARALESHLGKKIEAVVATELGGNTACAVETAMALQVPLVDADPAGRQPHQGRDHPVLLGVPETRYLKCLILRKL